LRTAEKILTMNLNSSKERNRAALMDVNAPPCLESLFFNVGVRTTLNDEALYVAILPLRMDNTPAAFESHNPAVKFR